MITLKLLFVSSKVESRAKGVRDNGSAAYPDSKFDIVGGPGKRYYIADVGNSGNKHQQSFKSQAETTVGNRTEFSQFQVPPVVGIQSHIIHPGHEKVKPLFPLTSADNFTDAGNKDIHAGNRPVVIV